jgi:hypothetical protein
MPTRIATQLVLVGAMLLLISAGAAALYPRPGAQRPVEADFLLSAGEADQLVPANLTPYVARLRSRAETAVKSKGSVLGKTLAVERLVHTAMRSSGATCVGYVTVMVALGRELGLPLRIAFGGTGVSNFDTHTTVSVWLERYRRWGIVDPTFGGTFTRGANERPLDVVDLRQAVIEGWWRQIVWHPSAADATPVSSYYVDPVFLFRYAGVYADFGGSVEPLALPDSRPMAGATYVVSTTALEGTPPPEVDAYRSLPTTFEDTKMTSYDVPPAYARRLLWQGQVTLPATIPTPTGSVVVWSSDRHIVVAEHPSARVDGGSLSPIVLSDGRLRVTGSGRATLRVYAVRRFASSPRL